MEMLAEMSQYEAIQFYALAPLSPREACVDVTGDVVGHAQILP